MKRSLFAAAVVMLSASASHSLDARAIRQLNALAPDERREQRCDIEAMERIRATGDYRPDKVIAYTFSDPIEKGDRVKAPGAVFRSRGDWYRLKFDCKTGAKGLDILSFDYRIGAKVPREEWERYYLYN